MRVHSLGDLERKIMDIVWESKSCLGRDVLNIIEKDKKLAYTTVATILQRLYVKGLLERKASASGYIYSPRVSKEKYSKNIAKNFIDNFINSFGDTAIASFIEGIDKLPNKKRKNFIKLIQEYDRNNK